MGPARSAMTRFADERGCSTRAEEVSRTGPERGTGCAIARALSYSEWPGLESRAGGTDMGVHRSAARRLACVAGALALLAAGCSRSPTAPLNQRLTGTVLDPRGAPPRYADVGAQTLFAI